MSLSALPSIREVPTDDEQPTRCLLGSPPCSGCLVTPAVRSERTALPQERRRRLGSLIRPEPRGQSCSPQASLSACFFFFSGGVEGWGGVVCLHVALYFVLPRIEAVGGREWESRACTVHRATTWELSRFVVCENGSSGGERRVLWAFISQQVWHEVESAQ